MENKDIQKEQEKEITKLSDFFIRWLLGELGHIDALLDFINKIMIDAGMKTFEKILLVNTYNLKDNKNLPETIVDVKAQTEDGEVIIIEVQLAGNEKFVNRVLLYIAENYLAAQEKKVDYDKIPKVISINLVNFDVNKTNDNPHSVFMLCDIKTGLPITDKMIIHFIEFKKYLEGASFDTEGLELWAKYFVCDDLDTIEEEIREKNKSLGDAVDYFRYFVADKELVSEYKKQRIAELGRIEMFNFEREKGEAIGLEKGKIEGEYNKAIQVAKNLLLNGIDTSVISSSTGLSIEQIEDIKKQL